MVSSHLSLIALASSPEILLLCRVLVHLGQLVRIQPLDGVVALVIDCLGFVSRDFVLHLLVFNGLLHVEAIAFQAILGRDSLFLLLVFSSELV